HNIYNAWAWTGGHNDGDCDLLGVAIKEAQEETGVQHFTPLSTEIFSIDVLPVASHMKKGKYVAPHLHLSVAYLLEADDREEVCIKADENSGVKWIPVEEVEAYTANEPAMQVLYRKFMDKVTKGV
ncbi:MAG: NUDIX hydrolase, partial [Cellulosilyticaceae bacterium]